MSQPNWMKSIITGSLLCFLLIAKTFLNNSLTFWQFWSQHINNNILISIFALDQEVLKFSIGIRITSFYLRSFFDLSLICHCNFVWTSISFMQQYFVVLNPTLDGNCMQILLCEERYSESSCVRKETVNIYILATSGTGDRKIMQCIRIMSRPPREKGSRTRWASSEEHLPK